MSRIGPAVPELLVADVERSQLYYHDVLGFEIGWLYPGKEIGAVSRGDAVIFFRRTTAPFTRSTLWMHAEDVEASYRELQASGAK